MSRRTKRKEARRLSDNPGTAILQAMEDLRRVEKDRKTYVIQMGYWHAGAEAEGGEGGRSEPCRVCLAGAVMAKRLGGDPRKDLFPDNFSWDIRRKLRALDFLRVGLLKEGLHIWTRGRTRRWVSATTARWCAGAGGPYATLGELTIPSYHSGRGDFMRFLDRLGRFLQVEWRRRGA